MIGRRVAVAFRFPAPARLPRSTAFPCQHDLPTRSLFYQSRRLYAKPGRPRKAVGEPSRPVKRAVKRAAPKATSPESPAKQKNEAKKKEAAAKKPAVKKPAPAKKSVKKPVTEEQKAAKAATLAKAKITDLKKAALQPPKIPANSAYNAFVCEKGSGIKGTNKDALLQTFGEHSKATAAQWKQLSSAEIEHYNHLAHTKLEAGQAEYKRWVESHAPEVIQLANKARVTLRRITPKEKGKHLHWPAIHDERAAKAPTRAYQQFVVNRNASGDFRNISFSERSKLIAQEWRALSESEKKKYKDLQTEDTKRYADEYSSTYGHPPPSFGDNHQPQAAAAAA